MIERVIEHVWVCLSTWYLCITTCSFLTSHVLLAVGLIINMANPGWIAVQFGHGIMPTSAAIHSGFCVLAILMRVQVHVCLHIFTHLSVIGFPHRVLVNLVH